VRRTLRAGRDVALRSRDDDEPRERVFNFGVCTKPSPYGWNPSIMPPREKANDATNIVRAAKAAKITIRLNLRIRRSYACAQSISLLRTGLRPTAPSNPLPFTPRSYQTSGCGDERQGIFQKSKFVASYRNPGKCRGPKRQNRGDC